MLVILCGGKLYAQGLGPSVSRPDALEIISDPALEERPEQTSGAVDEARTLLAALENGQEADRNRLAQLVKEVRQNTEISARDRFVVVARAEGLVIKETQGLNRTARFTAYENLARSLIAEFPDEAESYESLLALANDHPDQAKGAQLARQLQQMGAPDHVKAGAERLLARQAMVGLPLNFSFVDDRGRALTAEQFSGKVVVLYAWGGGGEKGPGWVRTLLHQGNSEVIFIGLNFESDVSEAQTKIRKVALGSRQVYDPAGLEGAVATQLNLSRIPSIYLIDRSGIVRSVNARKNLPQRLKELLAEGGPR